MEGSLHGKMRAVGQQDLQLEEEEDQDLEDKMFRDPFGALVKNCNMLHIVGPACVFLKQGFSQTLVCKNILTVSSHNPGAHLFTMLIHCHPCVMADPRLPTTPAVSSHCIAALAQTSNLSAPHVLREVDDSVPWKIID